MLLLPVWNTPCPAPLYLDPSCLSALCLPWQSSYFWCPSSLPANTQMLQTFQHLAVFHFLSLSFWLCSHHWHCCPATSVLTSSTHVTETSYGRKIPGEKPLDGSNMSVHVEATQGAVCMLIYSCLNSQRRSLQTNQNFASLAPISTVPLAFHQGQCCHLD